MWAEKFEEEMRASSPAPVTSTGSVGKAIRISWFIASDHRTEPKPVIRQVPVCQAAHPRGLGNELRGL